MTCKAGGLAYYGRFFLTNDLAGRLTLPGFAMATSKAAKGVKSIFIGPANNVYAVDHLLRFDRVGVAVWWFGPLVGKTDSPTNSINA